MFSTLLFGTTFIGAIFLKRRHTQLLNETYKDCKLLPIDSNLNKNAKLYEYKGYVLPEFAIKELKRIKQFQAKEDDIYVISFPKAGCTWLQEVVYLISTNFDYENAVKVGLETRFPYLEFPYPGITTIDKASSPRFIKTHLPFGLLPQDITEKSSKMIYIARNPKDVAVSYFHFVRMNKFSEYKGNFEEFLKRYFKGHVPYGPFWKHCNEYWSQRDNPNILFIFYEDLQKDFRTTVVTIANFLGKNLSEEELAILEKHCSFENMAHNPSVNYQHWDDLGMRNKDEAKFMRKGIVGDWHNYFSIESNQEITTWIDSNFENIKESFIFDLPKKS